MAPSWADCPSSRAPKPDSPEERLMDLARTVADSILAASADAVVATDRAGIIRIWNPGAERIFGHREDEALGQSLDLIIPERLRARHWDGFRQVIETGESRYSAGDLLQCPASAGTGSGSPWSSRSSL